MEVSKIFTTKVMEYITLRGISLELANEFLYNITLDEKPYGSPVQRKYNYVGVVTGGGFMASSYYPKKQPPKSLNIKKNYNFVINRKDAKTTYLFSSFWDFLSFLTLCGDGYKSVLRKNNFIVLKNTTKVEIKEALDNIPNTDEVKACFRNNKGGDTATNNLIKVFGNVIDTRNNFKEYISLNDKICGILKDG